MQTKPITPRQLTAINALLHKQGLMRHKAEIIESYTNGRTPSSREMTSAEAAELLSWLMAGQADKQDNSRLLRKLFAMAFEMGWCPAEKYVDADGQIKERKNYERLHAWVAKYGFKKTPLRSYEHNELPKLISIFETRIYKPWLSGINNSESADAETHGGHT